MKKKEKKIIQEILFFKLEKNCERKCKQDINEIVTYFKTILKEWILIWKELPKLTTMQTLINSYCRKPSVSDFEYI